MRRSVPRSLRIRGSVPALALALTLLAGTALADDGGIRLTRRDRLYDVVFSGDDAWIVGFPGLILHSRDRGASWELQEGGGRNALFSVDFVDSKRGWIAGRSGLLLHTADGGKTWTPQDSHTEQHLFAIDFLDAEQGWAVGNFATVIRTTDGGKTWTPVKVQGAATAATAEPAEDDVADDDVADDEGEGDEDDVADDDVADDEGGDAEAAPEIGPDFDRLLNGVVARGPDRALATGESGTVIETLDGGRTWVARKSGEWAPLYGVDFASERVGHVVGSQGVVLRTTDGGTSWARVPSSTEDHLFAFALRGETLFAVGRRGVLVQGSPATGLQPLPLGVYTWLSGLAFGPEGTGLLVGGQGLILRTTDGGRTWNNLGTKQ